MKIKKPGWKGIVFIILFLATLIFMINLAIDVAHYQNINGLWYFSISYWLFWPMLDINFFDSKPINMNNNNNPRQEEEFELDFDSALHPWGCLLSLLVICMLCAIPYLYLKSAFNWWILWWNWVGDYRVKWVTFMNEVVVYQSKIHWRNVLLPKKDC